MPLEPGCYVLSNSTLDDRSWPKVARAHLFYAAHRHLPGAELLARTMDFLADALPPGTHGAASAALLGDFSPTDARAQVFLPSEGYGTVSAAILTAGAPLGDRYYSAERSALLRQHRGDDPSTAAFTRLTPSF